MQTGKHLKVKSFGDNVLGVELKGNPKQPEPIHFRVKLPFGDIDIARCTNNDYWIHVRLDHPEDGKSPERLFGKFVDARLNVIGKHTVDCDRGDFSHPDLYHLAVRISHSYAP